MRWYVGARVGGDGLLLRGRRLRGAAMAARCTRLRHHRSDATLSRLDAVEGADDVHGSVVVLRRLPLLLRLLGQLDERAGDALQLAHVQIGRAHV